jgi:hypothetical protein
LDFMAELQRRGFQVVMCPGRLEITTNKAMRLKAIEDRLTVADQVNHAVLDIFDDEFLTRSETDRVEREIYRKETE